MISALTAICNLKWQTEKCHPMVSALGHHTPQERQSATMPEIMNNQPHQPIPAMLSWRYYSTDFSQRQKRFFPRSKLGFRAGRSTIEQIFNLWILCEKSPRPVTCLHRLQEGIWQGLACSLMGDHEEIHQCKPCQSYSNFTTKLGAQSSTMAMWMNGTVQLSESCMDAYFPHFL